MDSSVIESQKYPDLFVVSTTDFFYPLVEDPFEQGRIAAANVLSDMYAMGVVHVDNVLMILAASLDMEEKERDIVTRQLICGFEAACRDANTQVSGGQTVMNPWPIIGGVAKSICKQEDIIMPVNAVAGDVLVLTKPLGTQIAVNLQEWSRSKKANEWEARTKGVIAPEDAFHAFRRAAQSMCRLNRTAAELMHTHGAHCATDVTGFGILGHATNLAQNQTADIDFVIHTLPCLKGMAAIDDLRPGLFKLRRGLSAETSGGLLLALPRAAADAYCADIEKREGWKAYIVGDVTHREKDKLKNSALIAEICTIIEVE